MLIVRVVFFDERASPDTLNTIRAFSAPTQVMVVPYEHDQISIGIRKCPAVGDGGFGR